MIIIKGFEKAKQLLKREVPLEFCLQSSHSQSEHDENEVSTERTVRNIIADVQRNGDKALFDYTEKLDKAMLESLEVMPAEISEALKNVDKKLIAALEQSADRIYKFHITCKQKYDIGFFSDGLGKQVRPLNRVGIYVPGGSAAYPSTVLMTAIPARVAGVTEIIMATPPQTDGTIQTSTLVAASIAKVDRIFKIGGAQAIAALAFGTSSVPKVDKICGPGNVFVAMAKKLVYGTVDIDAIQGPSEVVIIADDTAIASICAADLIAQAEHDSMASAILITTSTQLATSVENEIKIQLSNLKRKEIAEAAMNSNGAIVLVDSIDEAIELANVYAPEHLFLVIRNADSYIKKIQNAGCVFINNSSPVVLGDYIAGPSHVLPTGGTARFSSPLNIEDFMKSINIVALDKNDQKALSQAAIDIAEAEGLQGHAQAIRLRLQAINE